jgi:hypothetical protein
MNLPHDCHLSPEDSCDCQIDYTEYPATDKQLLKIGFMLAGSEQVEKYREGKVFFDSFGLAKYISKKFDGISSTQASEIISAISNKNYSLLEKYV